VPIENEEFAAPVGVNTDFKQPAQAGLSLACEPGGDIKPFLARDFSTSVEARRLFWCYGYLLEMGLAMDQLRWVYAAHDMPWAFVQDASRHLWDESRHGDSGRSRLLDFGITLADLGFPTATDDSLALEGGTVEAMTPHEWYEAGLPHRHGRRDGSLRGEAPGLRRFRAGRRPRKRRDDALRHHR
jgi:hypothetical protein